MKVILFNLILQYHQELTLYRNCHPETLSSVRLKEQEERMNKNLKEIWNETSEINKTTKQLTDN